VLICSILPYSETIPDGSRRPRRYADDGGMAVDDGRRRKLYGSDGAYTEATVCGGGGQGGCVKSYKKYCFLCHLFISVTSRVLDKMYIKREREAHRLLQQIDTLQLHLFTAQLTLVKNNRQKPIATGKE